ncbi:unnamed protein product [Ambrosiozyma monospora]|uniref:Unnamed protein product n=1 Tax=Ambrosiozyma monospora TaxID=43982 RepID=A0A9W7DI89_AMBMO|nr:unnamed protein product [Ambrosiozyma monospora]
MAKIPCLFFGSGFTNSANLVQVGKSPIVPDELIVLAPHVSVATINICSIHEQFAHVGKNQLLDANKHHVITLTDEELAELKKEPKCLICLQANLLRRKITVKVQEKNI